MGSEIEIQQATSPRIGTPLFGLDEITSVSAIARDLAFVILCIVASIVLLLIVISLRKAIGRFNEAMDRVDDLLDSVVAARDAVAEFRDRIRRRGGDGSGDFERGFSVVSWLFTPLGLAIGRRFRRRARDDGDERRRGEEPRQS